MATTPRSKADAVQAGTPKASKETLEWVDRMKRDPKIQKLIRNGQAAERRGEGVRWEDLKHKYGGH